MAVGRLVVFAGLVVLAVLASRCAASDAPVFEDEPLDEVMADPILSLALERLQSGEHTEARALYHDVIDSGGANGTARDPEAARVARRKVREAHYRLAFLEYGVKAPLPMVFHHLEEATYYTDEPTPHDRLYHSGAGGIYMEQGMHARAQWQLVRAVNLEHLDASGSVNDHLNLVAVAGAAHDSDTVYHASVRCLRRARLECGRRLRAVVMNMMGGDETPACVDAALRALEDEGLVEALPWYWRARGLYLTHAGEFERAIAYHAKSLEVEGACDVLSLCYYARGMANIQAGHCNEARADFLTVLLTHDGLTPEPGGHVQNLIVNFHFSGEYARYSKISPLTDFVGVIGKPHGHALHPERFGPDVLAPLYFEQQHAVVTKLHDVWHEGESEIVHDGSGSIYLLGENGDANILQMVQPIDPSLPVLEFERGAILNPLASNYYHWTIEALSRLVVLLEDVLARDPTVKLVVGRRKQFAVETLRMLGVDLEERVVWYSPENFRYHFAELYFVDFRFPLEARDNIDLSPLELTRRQPVPSEIPVVPRSAAPPQLVRQCVHGYFPPMQVLLKLRERLSEGLSNSRDTHPSTILYVSRASQYLRAVHNEAMLIERLRHRFGRDFVVHTGHEEMEVQRNMFHNARLVIGLHGAGLSNMIYCQPNITVVEFPLVAPSFNYYGYLAVALGLDYWVVPEAATPYFQNLTVTEQLADTIVDTALHAFYGIPRGQIERVRPVQSSSLFGPLTLVPSAVALVIAFAFVSLFDMGRRAASPESQRKKVKAHKGAAVGE